MKDAEVVQPMSTMEGAERFQACFLAKQVELEEQIAASSTISPENLPAHFARISSVLQSMQQLYSSSALYVRIYDRKVCQDILHALQTKLQEEETKLIPRKKFVFKGKKIKNSVSSAPLKVNGAEKELQKMKVGVDIIDGPGTFVMRDRNDETIVLTPESVTGKALLLSNLENCRVEIKGAPSTVHIANASNCFISCGPVSTSVFVETVRCCRMQLACQQLRIHDTTDTDFLIYVTSRSIIEDCRGIRFGIYNFVYPSIDEDFILSGLQKDCNNWKEVDDFNWLVVGQPSPHWTTITQESS